MTVYYVVYYQRKFEGIFKIIGKWYNILIDFIIETIVSKTIKKGVLETVTRAIVFSDDFVNKYVYKLLKAYQGYGSQGAYGLQGLLFEITTIQHLEYISCDMVYDVYIRYKRPFVTELSISYFINNNKYEIIMEIENLYEIIYLEVYDPIDDITLRQAGPAELNNLEIIILDDLRKFKTLKEFHNYILEVTET